jgi:flotillin
MRAQTELERLRASDVVKATILREAKEQSALAEKYQANAKADASQYTERVNADAHAYAVEAEAAASFKAKQQTVQAERFEQETRAEAAFFAAQKAANAAAYKVEQEAAAAIKKAEADFITQKRKAEGLSAMASAYSDLSHAFGGPAGLIQYLMIERGVYQDLATANANAVKGMAPKMTIWNTGNEAGSDGSGNGANGLGGINSIRNIYQSLPPLMTTINEQTGVVLPEWQFGRLGEQLSEREISGKPIKGMSNGSK